MGVFRLLPKCDFSGNLTYRVLSAGNSRHGLREFAELCRYRMDPAIPAETGNQFRLPILGGLGVKP
jgi:hypothetical protein